MQVRRALEPLTGEGWQVRHARDWPGGGDLDHVVRSPSGMGFVIETKTLRWNRVHLARTIEAARWLARRRRRYPRGVVPVICVVHACSLERADGNLLIVSLDRLLPAVKVAAANGGRIAYSPPLWRAPLPDHARRPAGGWTRRWAGSSRR
jgi:hypothetical protein